MKIRPQSRADLAHLAEMIADIDVAMLTVLSRADELDTRPRKVELPADFKRALATDAAAKRFFEGLSVEPRRLQGRAESNRPVESLT